MQYSHPPLLCGTQESQAVISLCPVQGGNSPESVAVTAVEGHLFPETAPIALPLFACSSFSLKTFCLVSFHSVPTLAATVQGSSPPWTWPSKAHHCPHSWRSGARPFSILPAAAVTSLEMGAEGTQPTAIQVFGLKKKWRYINLSYFILFQDQIN